MKKVLGTALLAVVLGATSLQAAITSKDALNIAEKNFLGSSVKDIEMDVKNGVTFYKIESFKTASNKISRSMLTADRSLK
ncbi:PepSY domain-containing protein [Campylobacter concisus]|uniref:PepSY domain-containing protein n=1 Tax=Campylobacter concisus TaxID=199 RepID=UPI0015E1B61A|nr:PepSY domain-containing protein [Campylobacter concisus]